MRQANGLTPVSRQCHCDRTATRRKLSCLDKCQFTAECQKVRFNTIGENMERIESFKVNHLHLQKGLYVSRRDRRGDCIVTTFDMRMTAPNREPVIDMPALHTIEHLSATFLRNHERKDEIVYFGPMGCRTGCYLVMFGKLEPSDILELVLELCDFILGFEGEIPGAKAEECGNFREQNVDTAKYYISRYRQSLLEDGNFVYKA